jgi:hypothetical protein
MKNHFKPQNTFNGKSGVKLVDFSLEQAAFIRMAQPVKQANNTNTRKK